MRMLANNDTALVLVAQKDDGIIAMVRHHADTRRTAAQALVDSRLRGYCNIESCSGDDWWIATDGSPHEEHIDAAREQLEREAGDYTQLLNTLSDLFTEWRNESAVATP